VSLQTQRSNLLFGLDRNIARRLRQSLCSFAMTEN
jgi:hypothetical protein